MDNYCKRFNFKILLLYMSSSYVRSTLNPNEIPKHQLVKNCSRYVADMFLTAVIKCNIGVIRRSAVGTSPKVTD